MTRKLQVPENPFIVPDSAYRCSVPGCFGRGIWSPGILGGVWHCAAHVLPREQPPGDPSSPAYLAFKARWQQLCKPARRLDFESEEERRAIQAEGAE